MRAFLRFHYKEMCKDIDDWDEDKIIKLWCEFKFVKIQYGEFKEEK